MLHFEPKDYSVPEIHKLLVGGIGPRPIALVSTLSEDGINNLTPFSFFNLFGTNPPVIAFSPSRRGRDKSLKDSYHNLVNTKECVVQSVTYSMVEQINLASTEFPPEVDEFIKTGLTPVDSDLVKPKRVKESPFQMECLLRDMKSFGEGGASANIAICEIIKLHVAEDIFSNGIIHPDLIDLIGRMSGSFYARASGSALFNVEKPTLNFGIGYDQLPAFIKNSDIYSANNLGKFAGINSIPSDDEVKEFIKDFEGNILDNFEASEEAFYRYRRNNNFKYMLKTALLLSGKNHNKKRVFFELTAKCALENNDLIFAWKTAIYGSW